MARFGGDEFVVLCESIDHPTARAPRLVSRHVSFHPARHVAPRVSSPREALR